MARKKKSADDESELPMIDVDAAAEQMSAADESEKVKSDVEIVKIENVGPIAYAEIPIPKVGGGVLVLKGDSGTGKTEAINMIDALITKEGKLMPRYLAAKGTVSGFDLQINAGGTTTRKGDTPIATLDSAKFTFADLVDPPLAGMQQRHARRIQALLGLSGTEPDIGIFLKVIGGQDEFDKLLTPAEQKTKDPVALAGKIKDAIEEQARKAETLIENDIVNQKACEAAAKGIDLTQPSDVEQLQNALVEASNAFTRLDEQRGAYERAVETAKEAQERLDEHKGLSADRWATAIGKRDAAANERNRKAREQTDLFAEIEKMKTKAAELGRECEALDKQVEIHEQTMKDLQAEKTSIENWQKQVDSIKDIANPSDEAINAASAAVLTARNAYDLGTKIRTALEKKKEAEEIGKKNKLRQKYAESLRQKAANVFQALSDMIPKGPLYVVAGELVVDTEDRKAEPYQLLSTGERWELAIPYAIQAVGDGGFICISQDAWQHLSPTSRPKIAALCEKMGCWIITGEVSTGELRTEIYQQP